MSFTLVIQTIIMGIVQGITEWLPISSTGHMILFDEFMKMQVSDSFMETFLVVIQFGSILAVLFLYFGKLNPFTLHATPGDYKLSGSLSLKKDTISLYLKVLVAIIPAGVIGLLFEDKIDELFFNSYTVAATLIIYGILFIVIESKNLKPKFNDLDTLSYKTAFLIGMFQILALIPGTSRSGSTIIGATIIGCSRFVAAEFSFFLAIPVMLGASALKLLKAGFAFTGAEWCTLILGMIVAFAVSVAAIKFLMGYIRKHDFKGFGYYRIVLGILLIIYFVFIKM
ncbi:MAG: undecaprenyl-diphosphate phosphatase [Clostridia bacterium]|nr:undecaprenyl-diphosphate phosphatase [Clostridia bacterium]